MLDTDKYKNSDTDKYKNSFNNVENKKTFNNVENKKTFNNIENSAMYGDNIYQRIAKTLYPNFKTKSNQPEMYKTYEEQFNEDLLWMKYL